MPSQAYARRTKVSEPKTKAEIEDQLTKHECERVGAMTEPTRITFAFQKGSRTYRVGVDLPAADKPGGPQERRRRMRTLLLYIKGRLNAVEDGLALFEEEFLPEAVMEDGLTVREHAMRQVQQIESDGRMPAKLLLPGSTQ